MIQKKWFTFKVWEPADVDEEDGVVEEGYEYTEEAYGYTLEDAKERFRKDYPGVLILADEVGEDD